MQWRGKAGRGAQLARGRRLLKIVKDTGTWLCPFKAIACEVGVGALQILGPYAGQTGSATTNLSLPFHSCHPWVPAHSRLTECPRHTVLHH